MRNNTGKIPLRFQGFSASSPMFSFLVLSQVLLHENMALDLQLLFHFPPKMALFALFAG